MKIIKNLTIKNKLLVIIIFITSLTLVLCLTIIGIIGYFHFKKEAANSLMMFARVIGDSSVTVLAFDDRVEGENTLRRLEVVTAIEYSSILDINGDTFVSYSRNGKFKREKVPSNLQENEPQLIGDKFYILHPIVFQNDRYGAIFIQASTDELYNRVFESVVTAAVLLVILVLGSFFIAVFLQRVITKPILNLAAMAQNVSRDGDYSVRVIKEGEDEVGVLCDGFNNMLGQIELREMERTKAEEALRQSEQRFRTIIEQTNDPLCILNKDGIVLINDMFEKYFGYSINELSYEKLDFLKLVDERDKIRLLEMRKNIEIILQGDRTFEFTGVSKLGTNYYFEASIAPFQWDNSPAIIASLRDTTERKRIEESLKYRANSEMLISELSTSFINLSPEEFGDGIDYALKSLGELFQADRTYMYMLSEDHSIMHYVHEWCRHGLDLKLRDFLIVPTSNFPRMIEKLKKFETIYIPRVSDLDENAKLEKEALDTRGIKSFLSVPIVYTSKLIGFIAFDSVKYEKNWSEEDIRLIKMAGEIIALAMERNKSSEILAEEKERLSVTLRSLAEGVIATDTDGTIILMNKAAENLTEWLQDESMGKPLSSVFQLFNENRKRIVDPIKKVFEKDEVVEEKKPVTLITKNGKEIVISYNSSPIFDKKSKIIGVVLAFNDISDKIKMEEEMLKSSKIESLGVFAGGIAHDFNNILTAILGNINLAKLNHQPDTENYEFLEEAEKATTRAKDLTLQLLTFAKGGAPVKRITTITEILVDTTNFILSGSKVKCRYNIAEDLWPVEIDIGQISQVINNLVINAMQAMPNGGDINISVKNAVVKGSYMLQLEEGNYLKIAISDNGVGISKDDIYKIFDPFFTTKENGNGLGLASTFSIVKKHNGSIDVESVEGEGTTFYIYLPASIEEKIESSEEESQLYQGIGRVLVMDDEDVILKIAERFLDKLGYTVDTARNGEEVINYYSQSMDEGKIYDAVIMDLTIPGGMGGKECIKRLKEIDPKVKAIVSSGYSNDPVMSDYQKYGFKGVVTKPYRIQELSQTIKKIIN